MNKKYLKMPVEPCQTRKEWPNYIFDIQRDEEYFIITVYDENREARIRSICNKNVYANIILGRAKLSFSVRPLDELFTRELHEHGYGSSKFNRDTVTDVTEERVIQNFISTFGLSDNEDWYEKFVSLQGRIRDKRIYDKHLSIYKKAKAFERKSLCVPKLGNSFGTALKRALPNDHTSYYEKCEEGYQSICPCCGTLIQHDNVKHNAEITCLKCGEVLSLQNKSFFKKSEGYIRKDFTEGYFLWFVKSKKRVIGRLFYLTRRTEAQTYTCKTKVISEIARIVYQRNHDGTLNMEIYDNFYDARIKKHFFKRADYVYFIKGFNCFGYTSDYISVDVNYSNLKKVFRVTGILGDKFLKNLSTVDRCLCYEALKKISQEPWLEQLSKHNLTNILFENIGCSSFYQYTYGDTYNALKQIADEPLTSVFNKLGVAQNDIPFITNNNMNIAEITFFVNLLKKGIRMNQSELICLRKESVKLESLVEAIRQDFRIIPLINYLKRENTKKNHTLLDTLITLEDYWKLSKKLFKDLSSIQVRYPKNLYKKHDEYNEIASKNAAELEKRALDNIPNVYNKYKDIYSYQDKNYVIYPIESAENCRREAQSLKNCIYNGYAVKYGRDETMLLALREKKNKETPFYNVEVKDFEIRQYQGFNNQKNEQREQVREFLDSFINHVQRKVFKNAI